jgi:hypothetical protein
MNQLELQFAWAAIFGIGKGITYLLFMAALIKYLVT